VRAHDHQSGELLQHIINGLMYAAPRSLVVTVTHFNRVQQAITQARTQQQQQQQQQQLDVAETNSSQQRSCMESSNGGSSAAAGGGCLPLPRPMWGLDVVVDGKEAEPDLATLQGTMQVRCCYHSSSGFGGEGGRRSEAFADFLLWL